MNGARCAAGHIEEVVHIGIVIYCNTVSDVDAAATTDNNETMAMTTTTMHMH